MACFFQPSRALTISWGSHTPMTWSVCFQSVLLKIVFFFLSFLFLNYIHFTILHSVLLSVNFSILSFLPQGPCKNLTCFPPDIKCYGLCDISNVVVPLMENEVIKQQPVNFLDLERSYSDFAANFITTSVEKKQPFFLYYPTHVSNKSNLKKMHELKCAKSTFECNQCLKMCFHNGKYQLLCMSESF